MNEQIKERYFKLRKEHPTARASTALHWARAMLVREAATAEWDVPGPEEKEVEIGERDGFKITLKVMYDSDGSALEGRWLSRREVPLKKANGRALYPDKRITAPLIEITREMFDRWGHTRESFSRVHHIYQPAITYDEHYSGLRDLKYGQIGKHEADCLARKYVIEELKSRLDDEHAVYGVIVTAYREDVELGSASVWGVDTGPKPKDYDDHIKDVALDLISEALSEAQGKLDALVASTQKGE